MNHKSLPEHDTDTHWTRTHTLQAEVLPFSLLLNLLKTRCHRFYLFTALTTQGTNNKACNALYDVLIRPYWSALESVTSPHCTRLCLTHRPWLFDGRILHCSISPSMWETFKVSECEKKRNRKKGKTWAHCCETEFMSGGLQKINRYAELLD